jgi:hypothetical protein
MSSLQSMDIVTSSLEDSKGAQLPTSRDLATKTSRPCSPMNSDAPRPKTKRERAEENWKVLVSPVLDRALHNRRAEMLLRTHNFTAQLAQTFATIKHGFLAKMHRLRACSLLVHVQDIIITESEQFEKGSVERAKSLEKLHQVLRQISKRPRTDKIVVPNAARSVYMYAP